MKDKKELYCLQEVESKIFKFSLKDKIILQGDFNARCANLQDTVAFSKFFDQSNSIVDIPTNSHPNIPLKN